MNAKIMTYLTPTIVLTLVHCLAFLQSFAQSIPVDSIIHNDLQRIDSLTSLPNSLEQSVRKNLDSLTNNSRSAMKQSVSQLDSTIASHIDTLRAHSHRIRQNTEQKMDSLTAPLRQRYDSIQNYVQSIQEKASIDLPKSFDKSIIQEKLPKLPSLSPLAITEQLPSLEQLRTTLPERIPRIEFLDHIKSLKGTASEHIQQASGAVKQGVGAIEDAPTTLEQQTSRLSEVQVLQEQQSALETWKNNPWGSKLTNTDSKRIPI